MGAGQIRRGIWSGIPMPWTSDGVVDRNALAALVGRCAANGSDGIYVGGTTGEFHAMNIKQFTDVVETFMPAVGKHPGLGHQVGCGAFSQAQVHERIDIARVNGASALQVSLPGWLPLVDDEVLSFYREIDRCFSDVSIIVYDSSASGRNIAADLWPELLESVDSIVGGKFPFEDAQLPALIKSRRPNFRFFAVEGSLRSMIHSDIDGVTAWVSYSFPHIIRALWDASCAGDRSAAGRAFDQLEVLDQIKAKVRPKGYRSGVADRLMGLASGFLEPVFANVLPPWRSVAAEDVAWTRRQIVNRLGQEHLYG